MKRFSPVLFLSLIMMMIVINACSSGPVQPNQPSQSAISYVDMVLDKIKQQAFYADRINWHTIRSQARAKLGHAQTAAETYPTIRWILQQLRDHHSSFLAPQDPPQTGQSRGFGLLIAHATTANPKSVVIEVFPGSPAGLAGVKAGDLVQSVNGDSPDAQADWSALLNASQLTLTLLHRGQSNPFTVKLEPAVYTPYREPTGRIVNNDYGYLELPLMIGDQNGPVLASEYANALQSVIKKLDQQHPLKGWIVDLRLNRGGDMWPMLAGVGPVLGEGSVGGFDFRGNLPAETWSYAAGKAQVDQDTVMQVLQPYQLRHALPPTAVLTSHLTGSSGEAITVAFRGRPRTKSFCTATAGVPTANQIIRLSDGAQLVLTVGRDVDRTGRTYEKAISPDQPVPNDWSQFGTDRDPCLESALQWLQTA